MQQSGGLLLAGFHPGDTLVAVHSRTATQTTLRRITKKTHTTYVVWVFLLWYGGDSKD